MLPVFLGDLEIPVLLVFLMKSVPVGPFLGVELVLRRFFFGFFIGTTLKSSSRVLSPPVTSVTSPSVAPPVSSLGLRAIVVVLVTVVFVLPFLPLVPVLSALPVLLGVSALPIVPVLPVLSALPIPVVPVCRLCLQCPCRLPADPMLPGLSLWCL